MNLLVKWLVTRHGRLSQRGMKKIFGARIRSREAFQNLERWFFTALQDCMVSPEVESKYKNSLAFLRHCDALWRSHSRLT
jgi:hypothetical protein